jgi:small conductance mechanosensitive channel
MIQQGYADLLALAPDVLNRILTALVIVVAAIVLSRWLSKAVRAAAEREAHRENISLLLSRLTRWAILVLGLTLAAEQIIPNVTGLLAGLGIAGFTLGFALQDVAKNFIAGILILLQRPFELGDVINVSGFTGTVLDISLRTTDIRTADGLFVTIPNGDVFVSSITNFSRAPKRRIEIQAGVAYEADPELVERTALDAVQAVSGFLEQPQPQVIYHDLGDSAVQILVFFWVDTVQMDFLEARAQGIKRIKAAFDEAGIDMPYPTMAILTPGGSAPANQAETTPSG